MEFENMGIPAWKDRSPFKKDRFLYIPSFYEKHIENRIVFQESFFEKSQPIAIEFCSGNGEWIVNKAKNHPEWNWIAVEKRFDRVKKIWKKGKDLTNLFIVLGEAEICTQWYLPDDLASFVYINFPDPWPKRRHDKHRLIREEFTLELSRVMKKQGALVFVTDDFGSVERTCSVFLSQPMWKSSFPPPYFVTSWPEAYGSSYFDSLWREKGKDIHYLQWKNNK